MSIIEKAWQRLGQETVAEASEPEREGIHDAPATLLEQDVSADEASLGPVSGQVQTTASAAVDGPQEGSIAHGRSRMVDIDLESLRTAGMLTADTSDSRLAEEMRRIKRPLLSSTRFAERSAAAHSNLIMVTSSLPGEGKTFMAINLAISIAMELDRTVLLVDVDVAKSDVARRLGLGEPEGLTDYLTGRCKDLSDLMLRTNIPKLTVLPSGGHHPNITELLASLEMKRLVDELSVRYHDRVVIFDSPPMLATSGSQVLSGLAGQVMFVVRAEMTLKKHVQEAMRFLGRRDNVGLVLNRSREWLGAGDSYAYGYGYGGYGYGYGYGRNSREQTV